MKKLKIDKYTFFSALAILLMVCIPLILFPEQGEAIINKAFKFITHNLGFMYIWEGLAALVFAIWISFSKYGKIVLGDPNEKPEFKTFSWAGMLFCAGIGASILYWGTIEWAYYFTAPPFGLEKGTWLAAEWAATYGIFHWGPTGWILYSLPALPIGYSYFVKKKPVLKISEVCRGVLGDRVDGVLGKIIDVLFMFGLLGGAGTTLGLGTPMIAAGIHKVTGISQSVGLNLLILIIVTVIFSFSAYSGLKKGIKVLSDINIVLMLIILAIIFITGPTLFIIKMGTTSIGILIQNFVRMDTWMDPVLNTGFSENWTVFYWAWWTIYAPFMGLFIAKISRGRTIRNVIGGSVLFGTMGCALVFVILGNLGMSLQLTNALPVIEMLSENGAPETIISIISTLPLGNVVVILFTIVAIIFLATTFDSASYTLAAVTTEKISGDQDPARWNRLFWAFSLSLLPASLLIIDGPLSTLQTASIIGGLPITPIIVIMMVSFVKVLRKDEIEGKIKITSSENNRSCA
ncbi:BCCT family transporter [Abyssisolibacter fermentans]|uniref:BCCT family transporter n=1 Tax=Abyssisolibacter fermentans TaxID=1766203 RepID=UPI00082EB52A|nr:BCCT family transporter [Abyssisolibacter fermentans]